MAWAFDFETHLIAPARLAPPPVCMSVAISESEPILYDKGSWADVLREALSREPLIVGANVAFDLAVAVNAEPDLFPLVFHALDESRVTDVQIRQKLIDIAMGEYRLHGGYSLADLSQRLLDTHLEKENTWRLRYAELDGVPMADWPEDARQYPLDDALTTLACLDAQEEAANVLLDQFAQTRAAFALYLASAWGLRTDAVGVARLRAECEKRQSELQDILIREGLLVNARVPQPRGTPKGAPVEYTLKKSTKAAQARVIDAFKGMPPTTDKGNVRCDAEVCTDSGDPVLEAFTEYNQLGTLLSGHVAAMEQGIVTPIHTRFEILLNSGRTSSSSPNVQNVSRAAGARECFVPRPGWCYIGCDFDKAELHTLAQCCIDLFGRSALADALNGGFDPHLGLGATLAHTTYEDLAVRIKAGDESAKEWRQRAKPGNFGFPGGMGPYGMMRYAKSSYGVVLSEADAEHLYAGWQEQWPEVAYDYLGWIKRMTASGSCTIEHFVSHRWRGRCSYTEAANSFFQGRTADGKKAALYQVTKKCYTDGHTLSGCRVVNEVHDEIIIEAPLEIAPEAAIDLRDTMIAAYNVYTPDVPVHASPVLMDRWSKKAKQLFDESGRLQLWRYET